METTHTNNADSCAAGCGRCRFAESCIPTDAPAGWRLVLPAVCAFVLPVATAIAGAILCGPQAARGLLGGVAGLAVGALAGALLTWALRSRLAGGHA